MQTEIDINKYVSSIMLYQNYKIRLLYNPQILKLQAIELVPLISVCKEGCDFPMVIWSEFRMRQYRDNDHR